MAEAKSTLAFGRAALNFDLNESDYLVMTDEGIDTFEAMAYRFPNSSDLEEYMKDTIRVKSGYKDAAGNLTTFAKPSVEPWSTFKSGEDAGCIRKLWGYSHRVAKKELEALVSLDEVSNRKVTLTMSQEMEERAIGEGMPVPVSDKDRPSLHALTKAMQAYDVGGTFQYLVWETYLDMEWEGRLRRAGKLPRDKQELVYTGSKVTVKQKDEELPPVMEVYDASDLREVLDIRARTFHMIMVCEYEVCRQLTERYLSKMRAR